MQASVRIIHKLQSAYTIFQYLPAYDRNFPERKTLLKRALVFRANDLTSEIRGEFPYEAFDRHIATIPSIDAGYPRIYTKGIGHLQHLLPPTPSLILYHETPFDSPPVDISFSLPPRLQSLTAPFQSDTLPSRILTTTTLTSSPSIKLPLPPSPSDRSL